MATHSIFGASAPPGTIGSYTDAGSGSVLMQQFYIVGAPTRVGWTIEAVRIFLPAGSTLIGRTGSVGLIRRPAVSGGIYGYNSSITNDFYLNGANKAFSTPLVAGWNERPLNGTYAIENGDGILAGYNLGGGYLYSADVSSSSIGSATAPNLYLCEIGSGTDAHRTWYSDSSNADIKSTASRFYGIDIVVNDNVGGSSGVGSASDDIQFTDTAVGVRKPVGNASDDIQFTDTAAGVRKPVGSASDDIQFTDSAVGFAPPVGGAGGTALSTLSLSDSAQGSRISRGSSVSTLQFSDSASGGAAAQFQRDIYRRSRYNGSWTAWVAD